MALPPDILPIHAEEASLMSRLVRCKRGDGGLMFLDPGALMEVRSDWVQVIAPRSKGAYHNAVLRCRLESSLCDRALTRVTAAADARGSDLRWFVGPSSEPADLGRRLESAGFTPQDEMRVMAVVPTASRATIRDGITVREIEPDEAELWTRTAIEGFGAWLEPVEDTVSEIRHVLGSGREQRWVLAFLDGRPVGAASVAFIPAGGYLSGASVVPGARRRGVYEALLAARVALLRAQEAHVAIVHAGAASAALCARFGFEDVCRARWYLRPRRVATTDGQSTQR